MNSLQRFAATSRIVSGRTARPRYFMVSRFNSTTAEEKLPAEADKTTSVPTPRYDIISGAPVELSTKRTVRIYQRAKTAMQSGTFETKPWRLDWDIDQKLNRWENDMMGWQSSGDYMQATQVKFKSKEDAVRFATNQGWDYYVVEPHKRDFRPKQYATNFLHSPGPLKHIRTK
ncbi:ETC complex I subunit conserved region-domain-containing protein [Dipodascopsis uninucleata]